MARASRLDLQVQVHGLVEAEERIESLGVRAINAEPALEQIMKEIEVAEVEQWTFQRGWKPLADSTKERKILHSEETLVRTGALRASLTEPSAPNAIRELWPGGLKYGTSLWYANFPQKGTPTEPKRPLIKLTVSTRRIIGAILARWVAEGF